MMAPSTLPIDWIRQQVTAGQYQISEHVIRFLMAGLLTIPEIEAALQTGEVIQIQQDSLHRPESVLIRAQITEKTIIVQASSTSENGLVISLAYLPDDPTWPELSSAPPDKGTPMKNPFQHCFFCGGKIKAITVGNFDYRLDGKLYVIKDTPAGLCLRCGEKYVTAETAKSINRLIEKGEFTGTEKVRVMAFGPGDAAD